MYKLRGTFRREPGNVGLPLVLETDTYKWYLLARLGYWLWTFNANWHTPYMEIVRVIDNKVVYPK